MNGNWQCPASQRVLRALPCLLAASRGRRLASPRPHSRSEDLKSEGTGVAEAEACTTDRRRPEHGDNRKCIPRREEGRVE